MNANIKSNIAIVLSVVAILISTFFGGIPTGSQNATSGEAFIKSVARESGLSGRTFDKCYSDETGEMSERVGADISEVENFATMAGLDGVGTPFNIIITDTQVIPVPGAYPYEIFSILFNEINTLGEVSTEILESFQINSVDSSLRHVLRNFDPKEDHYQGSENPEILLIEYSDFECPYCASVHPTLDRLVSEHDNFTWVYRHLPLNFHPQAFPAAIASECVAEFEGNKAFWNFADTLFENQDKLK